MTDISEWLKFGGKLAMKLSISQGGVLIDSGMWTFLSQGEMYRVWVSGNFMDCQL
jgi:hypothetical protein